MISIWKDYYVQLGYDEKVSYRINCNGDIAYQGIAHRRPGASTIPIKINDICAGYFGKRVIPADKTPTLVPVVDFSVQIWEGASLETIDEDTIVADWSYDRKFNNFGMYSFPINGHVCKGMPIVFTKYADYTSLFIHLGKGNSVIDNEDIELPSDMQLYDLSYTPTTYIEYDWAEIEGNRYTFVNNCHRYALYYVNAYGGWDFLLIEGNHKEQDSLIRHTRETEYDNRSISNRGRINYVNEISKSITLHTSWLSDEQSSRMHHLLNSTEVLLFDIESKEMIPVILKNTTTEYMSYKSNGGKLVNYTLEVEYANGMTRQ